MTPENKTGNVANFCAALGNVSSEMIAAGIDPANLAAALRIEADKVQAAVKRTALPYDEVEMLDVQWRAQEFVNTLQVAGIDERIAITATHNALIERVVRTNGAAGAAHWLRNMASLVDSNGDALEQVARQH